ncbi:MAG: hypothetical protein K0S53_1369 [Bacteroidetes bacterium]|jgi:hypothetical protein|nr:hypothetical protein [Bacteroidota bacterium]MDF2450706.1 hypothetical protein [Bacteroidota bacterium]
MKKLSLALLLMSAIINCYAGDDFSAKAEIKKRKLVVVLLDENPETISELKSKGKDSEIPVYLENIKKDNEITKATFAEFWKETPVEFIQESKILSYTLDDLSKLTVITHEAASIEGVEFLKYEVCLGYSETNKKGKTNFDLYHKSFKFSCENDVPSPADLLLLVHKIRVYYDLDKQFDLKTLDAKLAKKTLLIDKDATEMTNEEIKDAYEFPFKLVSAADIAASKNSRDKGTVYLKLDVFKAGAGGAQQAFLLVDSETGQILSRSLMGGITKVAIVEARASSRGFDGTSQLSGVLQPEYRRTIRAGITGPEMVRLYTARAKLKKSVLKVLASQKIQNSSMFSVALIPY